MVVWSDIDTAVASALAGAVVGAVITEYLAYRRDVRARAERAGRAAALLSPILKGQLNWTTKLPSDPGLITDPKHQLAVPSNLFPGLRFEAIMDRVLDLPRADRSEVALALIMSEFMARSVRMASTVSKQTLGAMDWSTEGRAWTSEDSKAPDFVRAYRSVLEMRDEFQPAVRDGMKRLEPWLKSVL